MQRHPGLLQPGACVGQVARPGQLRPGDEVVGHQGDLAAGGEQLGNADPDRPADRVPDHDGAARQRTVRSGSRRLEYRTGGADVRPGLDAVVPAPVARPGADQHRAIVGVDVRGRYLPAKLQLDPEPRALAGQPVGDAGRAALRARGGSAPG